MICNETISNNIPLRMIQYNDDYYFESEIICTTLPLMNIYTNENALNNAEDLGLDWSKNEINMRITVFDNSNSMQNRTEEYDGSIAVRGSGTSVYPKKGFKLELFEKEVEDNKQKTKSLFGLRDDNVYYLYAGYNDPERIRNVFCTNLWHETCAKDNSLGITNGTQYKYIELFINNEYWGLYAICAPIDEIQEEINKNDISENIYKKYNFWANEYKMNETKDYSLGYELRTNDGNKEAWLPLINYYGSLFNAKKYNDIYNLIDIDNCIDFYLFYNFTQSADSVKRTDEEKLLLNNTYLISKRIDEKLIMLYAPWDLDRTFGKAVASFKDESVYNIDYDKNYIMEINPIHLLMEIGDEDIKKAMNDKYRNLRNNEWSDASLLSMLDKYCQDIFDSGVYSRDLERWLESAHFETNKKLDVFKEYVLNRATYCDENVMNY